MSLYHTPDLRGWKKKLLPAKFNETVGLQHCKLYVFDNSVMISGANLSTDYFTNRQDRYIVVEDCEPLATFCESLVRKISEFSLELQSDGSFRMPHSWSGGHPFEGDYQKFVSSAKASLRGWLKAYHQAHRVTFNGAESVFQTASEQHTTEAADTWIFPSIQMGPFDVRHDSDLTERFLQSTGIQGALLKLSTGYFNLTSTYQNVILNSEAKYEVLCAHPQANGFLGARFPLGGIPSAYSLILEQFLRSVIKKNHQTRISLFEYRRPDWTFHAKGLWYYLPGSSFPIASMVGSANYGHRSVEKDLEAQMTIVTRNEGLQRALHGEQERLFQSAEAVTERTLMERRIPLWVKCVVGAFRKLF